MVVDVRGVRSVLVLAVLAAAALLSSATSARASTARFVDATSIPIFGSAGDFAAGEPAVHPGGLAHVATPVHSSRQAATLPHYRGVVRGGWIGVVEAGASGSKTVAERPGRLAGFASAGRGKAGGAGARVMPRGGDGQPAAKRAFDWAPLEIFAGLLVVAIGGFFLRSVRRFLARARMKGH